MTLDERRTAEFFVHLSRADLHVPAERSRLRHELWEQLARIGHIDIAPPMGDGIFPNKGMYATVDLYADDDVDEDRVLRLLFDRILDRLHGVCKVLFSILLPETSGLTGIPLSATVQVQFKRQDDGSIVATVYSQDSLSDLFWQGFLPLLQRKPSPFVICEWWQCMKPFVRKDKGVTPKYCSPSCKERGIPFASRRAEYMRKRRQSEHEKQLQLAWDAIRKGQSEEEQIALLSKALPQKSRRACVQLLNKARRRQKRTKSMKEKED